jgi:hypothetical protein
LPLPLLLEGENFKGHMGLISARKSLMSSVTWPYNCTELTWGIFKTDFATFFSSFRSVL